MIVSVIVLVIGSGYSPACEPFSALNAPYAMWGA